MNYPIHARLRQSFLFVIDMLCKMARFALIAGIGTVLAMGILNIVQGLFHLVSYFWLSKEPHSYPVNLEILFWGLKFIALYLVIIFLLSQYRTSLANLAIIRRSSIFGLVFGVFLIGAIALDRFVINYYSNQIDCELPDPTSRNLRPENPTLLK